MSRALKAQGVPTELHMAPNEGHQWVQPVHELYKMNVEMEWIEKYVRTIRYIPEPVPSHNP
jgi:dipeptidyl aminopeptidase/acylaminoacyl peptidase